MSFLITKYVIYDDINLSCKLENMLFSEISKKTYEKCMEKKNFKKIEKKVWALIKNSASKFSKADYYKGLADEYDAEDEHDKWSACLYNCDLLYMTAIAHVLKLEIPKTSSDIHIFGIHTF